LNQKFVRLDDRRAFGNDSDILIAVEVALLSLLPYLPISRISQEDRLMNLLTISLDIIHSGG